MTPDPLRRLLAAAILAAALVACGGSPPDGDPTAEPDAPSPDVDVAAPQDDVADDGPTSTPDEPSPDPQADETDAESATAGAPSDGDDTPSVERPLDEVPPLHPSIDDYPEGMVAVDRGDEGRLEIPVKVAADPELRQHGLMEVSELPAGTGMLFVFEQEHTGQFWMKDTLVPLDIAFVDDAGEIVSILSMEPCEEEPCPTYGPDTPYSLALEVTQGWFADVGVETGDELTWSPTD